MENKLKMKKKKKKKLTEKSFWFGLPYFPCRFLYICKVSEKILE